MVTASPVVPLIEAPQAKPVGVDQERTPEPLDCRYCVPVESDVGRVYVALAVCVPAVNVV